MKNEISEDNMYLEVPQGSVVGSLYLFSTVICTRRYKTYSAVLFADDNMFVADAVNSSIELKKAKH